MGAWWQSWGQRTAVIVAAILGAFFVFLVFCLFTPAGHGVVEALIEPLSGGRIAVSGLSGDLPNHLNARRVTLRDAAGAWLVIEDVSLDWDAVSALGDHIAITRVSAANVIMARRKIPHPSPSTSTTTIDIGALHIDRLELKAPALGHAAVLTATGSLHYTSRHDVAAELVVQRLDSTGRYDIHAAIANDILTGTISIAETGRGLAGGAIGLPDLGSVALELRATAEGTRNSVQLKFQANHMDVSGNGTMDIAAEQADIAFSARAQEMHPSKDLSWSSIAAQGRVQGSFSAPNIAATLRIGDLAANGVRMAALSGTLEGAGGQVNLRLSVEGLTLPGEKAGLFATAPLAVSAKMALNTPPRTVTFALDHPLLHLTGTSATRGVISGRITAAVPALDRFSPLTGSKTPGNASATLDFARNATGLDLTAKGTVSVTGTSAIAKLLGKTVLEATAHLGAEGALALRTNLKGAAIRAEISGSQRNGRRDFTGDVGITDLSRLSATIAGSFSLRGSLQGPVDNAKLTLNGTAAAATKGMARQTITIAAEASGLPKLKAATLRLAGSFDGAPVKLNSDIAPAGADAWKLSIAEGSWRSARLGGAVTLAGTALRGSLQLAVANLADIAALAGVPLSGTIAADTELQPGLATVHLVGNAIVSGTATLGHVELGGTIHDPLGSPVLALTLNIPQLTTSAVSGSAALRLNGPPNALSANLTTALTLTDGHHFSVDADASADTSAKHLTVTHLQGLWRDQIITLAAPATIDFANGLSFAAHFIDGKAADLTLTGNIPPAPHAMTLHAVGKADLAVLTSELAAAGQVIRGTLTVDLTATGTLAKPNVTGGVTLRGAQVQDYPRGINLTEVSAQAEAQGSALRFTKFTGKAGPGSISGSGSIDLAGAGMPVDMSFTARNARAVTSDLITANVDADLKLTGHLSERLLLSGRIAAQRGTINIPEKFPREIATLNISRSRNVAPPPPPPSSALVALDLTLASEGQIFVRGRGLEAEFEGDLKIGGSSAYPQVDGALTMRRGTFSLAGTNLTFQSGQISFNGQALRHRLDPTLDLVAQSQANGITATLKITGTASQPRIALSSSPPLPQDEVLAQLLFQQSAKTLSALQLASVAQAAASLSGGPGFDPVGIMRSSLGLDRLAVGSTQDASGGAGSTTIEAGKYVFRNVYVGARQDLSGGTRALVQVDITKHLKAQAQVITGPRAVTTTTSTPLTDNGDSIGLSYQFEY
ncbi:MAG: translocation/assembly module TamB domain-containing protein [Rhizomicrobium sp.]|nr:translocation/assembly module TamB domain-containing protein [Rhizomicrobium sp.]